MGVAEDPADIEKNLTASRTPFRAAGSRILGAAAYITILPCEGIPAITIMKRMSLAHEGTAPTLLAFVQVWVRDVCALSRLGFHMLKETSRSFSQ